MTELERVIRELRRQKMKYHAKVVSTSAIYLNLLRSFDVYDLTAFYVWLALPEFNYASLSLSLSFDIPLAEIEPANLEFEVELPDVSEMLQGILVRISRKAIEEVEEWVKQVDLTIDENIVEEAAATIKASLLRKGVFGKTRYNMSYYDPPAVRDFLRSTLLRLWQNLMTPDALRKSLAAAAETVGIQEWVTKLAYNRIAMVFQAQREVMILGYGVLGVSRLGRRGSDTGVMAFVDFDGNRVEVKFNALDHLQWGFILGLTPLGYGLLLPRDSIYKKEPVVTATGHRTVGGPKAVRFMEKKARRILNTFSFTNLALANYSRIDEQRDYLKSERADQWAELQLMRYHVENIVSNLLAGVEGNPVKLRLYKTAALQLVSFKAKRHAWGYKGFEAMSEEEFKRWWLEHWAAQGLNPELLERIYAAVGRWAREWRLQKLWKGVRLRLRRYSLARSLAPS